MPLLPLLGLHPPARTTAATAAQQPHDSGDSDASAQASSKPAKPGHATKPPEGKLELGGASFDQLSIGAEVAGPRLKTLWVLLGQDGSGPATADESWKSSDLNRKGVETQALFRRMHELELVVYDDYGKVKKAAEASKGELAKLVSVAKAVGAHSKGEGQKETYVRNGVNGYIQGIDDVRHQFGELTSTSQYLDSAVAAAHAAALRAEAVQTAQQVDDLKEDVETEKKRIEDLKKSLGELLDFAVKVVNVTEWAELASEATTYFGKQFIDASIPTAKLDQLEKQLKDAQSKLRKLNSAEALALMQEKADELRARTTELNTARTDLVVAVDKLGRAQATAIDALKKADPSKAAATIVAHRSQTLGLIVKARQTILKYRGACDPSIAQIGKLAGEYNAQASTPMLKNGVDRKGPWVKSLTATARDNAEVLGVWSSYLTDIKASCDSMLGWLNTEGEGGPMEYFDQVRDVLSGALKG